MGIFDYLIGKEGIDKSREYADKATIAQYNPNIYNPMLEDARYQASEGIVDEPIRTKAISSIFASGNPMLPLYGGNQAAAISGTQAQNANNMTALSKAEVDISMAEEQAKLQGRSRVAEFMSKIKETNAMREAKLQENRMMAESEASKRKFGLLGSVIGLGASYLTGGGSLSFLTNMFKDDKDILSDDKPLSML